MPSYYVYICCSECSEAHRLDSPVELPDGPSKIMSVQKAYFGRAIPTQLASVIARFSYCTQKRRDAIQNNLGRIFLADV
jgi:hypothetical protein